MSSSVLTRTPALPWNIAWKERISSMGMTEATSQHFWVSCDVSQHRDQLGDAPADMLNKQGGADARPFGILLITSNV